MKARTFLARALFCGCLLVLSGFTLAGCKSTPKVDWNSRVGSFTYDQAVAELGPPDKSTKLSDGKTVADWIKHSSGGVTFGLGTGYWGHGAGVGMGQSVGTGYGDRILRLVFGPENKLVSWSKNY